MLDSFGRQIVLSLYAARNLWPANDCKSYMQTEGPKKAFKLLWKDTQALHLILIVYSGIYFHIIGIIFIGMIFRLGLLPT